MPQTNYHLIRRQQRLHTWLMVVQTGLVFGVIFLFFTVYANWPAYRTLIAYHASNNSPSAQSTPTVVPSPVTRSSSPKQVIEPPHLIIASIGVDVPITWQVPVDRTLDYLSRGVAHLAGSATPGQIGNMFITGHSSDYAWRNNPYAAIFALVPKLKIGDSLVIKENGAAFEYRVAQTRIVAPDNVEVTQPTTSAVLTLMTCYPIGSTKERYIVHATLVGDPTGPAAATPSQVLPEIKFR